MNERLISRGITKEGVRYSLVEYDGGIGKFIVLDGKYADISSWTPPLDYKSWMDMIEQKLPPLDLTKPPRHYPIFRRRRKASLKPA